jgi:hypothetical protein
MELLRGEWVGDAACRSWGALTTGLESAYSRG